ncbi:hypothetical protein PIB30_043824 [Stylosanthes scabra]|uniref:Uncharacterized protein n=1 Tax=Stylosanthes scabra TaxID=79078 RepID=A0ABU6VDY0_9FABA|nr:hypothetical protein [Stylosanthes scabra]
MGTKFIQQSENGDLYFVELAEDPHLFMEEDQFVALEAKEPTGREMELVQDVNRSLNLKRDREEDCHAQNENIVEENLEGFLNKRKTDACLTMAEEGELGRGIYFWSTRTKGKEKVVDGPCAEGNKSRSTNNVHR